MAAPLSEGMRYFPHSTNASNDIKIAELRLLHGNDGYAFYFIILELAYQNNDGKVSINSENKIKILAKFIGITVKKFETLVKVCVNLKLFDENIFNTEKCLTSEGILKRIGKVNNERDLDRNRKKSKGNSDRNTDGIQQESGSNPALKERKGKEIKEKETKINNIGGSNTVIGESSSPVSEKDISELSYDESVCKSDYELLWMVYDDIRCHNPKQPLVTGNMQPGDLSSLNANLKQLLKLCDHDYELFRETLANKINDSYWARAIAGCNYSPVRVVSKACGQAISDFRKQEDDYGHRPRYQQEPCPQEIPDYIPSPEEIAEIKAQMAKGNR